MENNQIAQKIAVIGAGFSGAMVTAHLVKHTTYPLQIHLFEKTGNFAEGIAYSTTNPNHLLNVRAKGMTAYPDEPEHFLQWLKSAEEEWRGLHPDLAKVTITAEDFPPRMVYCAYIKAQFRWALENAAARGCEITCHTTEVNDISLDNGRCTLITPKGEFSVDAAILTVGNLPPKEYRYEKKLFPAASRFARNVWNPPAANILQKAIEAKTSEHPVVLIGTGLTMVDTVISLRDKSYKGKIITFSRHGHLPRVHEQYAPYPKAFAAEDLPKTALGLLRWLRATISKAEGEGYNWRAVIDNLRPITNPVWARLSKQEKRTFLRHLFSLWNIHRHRMPQESATLLKAMEESGQLIRMKGQVIDADANGDTLVISYRQKNKPGIHTMEASYLLNCAGSEMDIGKLPRTHLLYRLRDHGIIAEGTLRSGIELQSDGRLKGSGADYVFAMGPVFFGTHLETIAVPELRVQAQELALFVLKAVKERDNSNFVI